MYRGELADQGYARIWKERAQPEQRKDQSPSGPGMLEAIRRLGTGTSNLHQGMKDTADMVGAFLVDAFHLLALVAIVATTVWSAAAALIGMAAQVARASETMERYLEGPHYRSPTSYTVPPDSVGQGSYHAPCSSPCTLWRNLRSSVPFN